MRTLLQDWRRLVRRDPGATAMIEAATGLRCSRAALEQAAAARAAAWRPLLPRWDGRLVAFSRPNGAEWWTCFLALWHLGAVPVPLDPSEPPAAQEALARAARSHGWIDPEGTPRALPAPRARAPAGCCLVKLTSGSTGRPRALPFTHAQMRADGRNVCRTMGIEPGDLNLALIPLGHSYGLGNLVVPLLAQGTALVVPSAPLPGVLAAEIDRWRPTVFPAVPAVLRALATSEVPAKQLASLRTVVSAGSPLEPAVARAFAERFGRCVHNFYGSSETGGIAYDRSGEAGMTGRAVGTPLRGVRLRLGRGGRFTVHSAAVATCGLRRGPDGGFAPADRGRLNEHGELVLLGRAGRMLKIAGRRIDLGELEVALRRLPGLRDACAEPHPDREGELAVAVASDLADADVRSILRRHLAPWKFPRRLVVLREFPLTARGKPDRAALRALLRG